jgi:hypothetical protein
MLHYIASHCRAGPAWWPLPRISRESLPGIRDPVHAKERDGTSDGRLAVLASSTSLSDRVCYVRADDRRRRAVRTIDGDAALRASYWVSRSGLSVLVGNGIRVKSLTVSLSPSMLLRRHADCSLLCVCLDSCGVSNNVHYRSYPSSSTSSL